MKTLALFTTLIAFAGAALAADSAKPAATATPASEPIAPAAMERSAAPSDPSTPSVADYVTVVRAELKSGVVQIYSALMNFSEKDAQIFWSVYHDYEGELFKLGDHRIALLTEFAKAKQSGSWDNIKADKMAAQWLDLQDARIKLWKKYQQIYAKKLSPLYAVQFLYIEHEIALVIELGISAELSLIAPVKDATTAVTAPASGPTTPTAP